MNTSFTEPSVQRRGIATAKGLTILRCHPWHTLPIIFILILSGTGCRIGLSTSKIEDTVHSQKDLAATQQQVRLRMRALVEPLCGGIIESADRIMAGTTNRVVRREALLWKIEAVPALRQSLFRPNPFVAVMDSWVLAWQMADFFESGRGREALGEEGLIAAKTCRDLATEIEEVASSLTTSGDVSDAAKFARNWAREHPIQYSIRGRESTLSRVTERQLQESLSTQEVAANMVVTLDDLMRRMDVYSAQLPNESRWQAELFAMDLEDNYHLQQTMPLAETAVQSATDAVAVLKRLEPSVQDTLGVAKTAPELINRERAATITAVQGEISRSLEFVRTERLATMDYVTRERQAALKDLSQAMAEERKTILNDSDRIAQRAVDHATLRAAQLMAVVLACVFIGIVILLLITRRVFVVRVSSHEQKGQP